MVSILVYLGVRSACSPKWHTDVYIMPLILNRLRLSVLLCLVYGILIIPIRHYRVYDRAVNVARPTFIYINTVKAVNVITAVFLLAVMHMNDLLRSVLLL